MSNILKKDTEKDVLNNTPGTYATVRCLQVSLFMVVSRSWQVVQTCQLCYFCASYLTSSAQKQRQK